MAVSVYPELDMYMDILYDIYDMSDRNIIITETEKSICGSGLARLNIVGECCAFITLHIISLSAV